MTRVGNENALVISVYESTISTERVQLLNYPSLGRNISNKRMFFLMKELVDTTACPYGHA